MKTLSLILGTVLALGTTSQAWRGCQCVDNPAFLYDKAYTHERGHEFEDWGNLDQTVLCCTKAGGTMRGRGWGDDEDLLNDDVTQADRCVDQSDITIFYDCCKYMETADVHCFDREPCKYDKCPS